MEVLSLIIYTKYFWDFDMIVAVQIECGRLMEGRLMEVRLYK